MAGVLMLRRQARAVMVVPKGQPQAPAHEVPLAEGTDVIGGDAPDGWRMSIAIWTTFRTLICEGRVERPWHPFDGEQLW